DSYSSNWQLDISKEMEAVLDSPYFSKIAYMEAMEKVLKWATINGATALGIQKTYGSFEKGKRPGIVLLENVQQRNLRSTRVL
ncbi:MAG TPA: amidohydrolase family protein, partial [Flavitalea sp.]|nr:amidohydrolase family protein [Flavitalea sp.]